ncbi:myelin-oligodendrocyte glycoprotein-like [Xenopus tropicalis]|nr:myelin-oligodendrocyte glycoprotein-like [Xenopus tropicalis]|eukprot:XP_012825361.1 PREDICTED: myelin-oligodendrocyte glycoprotein-like [Xenopus tropicalis]
MAGLKKIPIFTFMAILATLQPSFAQWFKVIASHTPVIAPVGSDADLGCYLVPAGSAESMTIKFHRGDPNSYVYVYNKRLDDTGNQDEEYKGRTEFLTENIGQGQVTVRIKNFQPSDIAFYTCIFASDDHVDFATLELKEAPPADSLTGGQIVGIVAGSIAAAVAAAAVALGWCHFKNRRRDKELAQLRTELKNDLKRERMKELIRDAGYPCGRWLITPIHRPRSLADRAFNQAHVRARSVIERTFGVLKSWFRCLDKSGGSLMYSPTKVANFVGACAVLHNLANRHGLPGDVADDLEDPIHPPDPVQSADARGSQVRGQIIYFNYFA